MHVLDHTLKLRQNNQLFSPIAYVYITSTRPSLSSMAIMIIVVIAEKTKSSWWVPFEIGMSAQIDMPTASFSTTEVVLPSYLSYWPRLKSVGDIPKYITVRKRTRETITEQYHNYSLETKKSMETRIFYENLKKELR